MNVHTSDILPPHWLRSDIDNVDREISGSLVDRELWPAEREGGINIESSPMTHAVGNKRFSKITSEEELAAMSRGITIPNTKKKLPIGQ